MTETDAKKFATTDSQHQELLEIIAQTQKEQVAEMLVAMENASAGLTEFLNECEIRLTLEMRDYPIADGDLGVTFGGTNSDLIRVNSLKGLLIALTDKYVECPDLIADRLRSIGEFALDLARPLKQTVSRS